MYTQKLETKDLFSEKQPYNGVRTYAQTKRAQVILNELWATRFGTCGVSSACMHPGWAATPGVATSLPRFNRLFQKVLRDSDQGADTLLWLATQGPAMSCPQKGQLLLCNPTVHFLSWRDHFSWSLTNSLFS